MSFSEQSFSILFFFIILSIVFCKTCSRGYYYSSRLDRCLRCDAGEYCVNSVGKKCPRHTYQDQKGQTTCKDCPENTYTWHIGADRKDDCDCDNGYYPVGTGELYECKLCPVGHYCEWNNKYRCKAGTYQNKRGKSKCLNCGSGKTSSVGATSCRNKKKEKKSRRRRRRRRRRMYHDRR